MSLMPLVGRPALHKTRSIHKCSTHMYWQLSWNGRPCVIWEGYCVTCTQTVRDAFVRFQSSLVSKPPLLQKCRNGSSEIHACVAMKPVGAGLSCWTVSCMDESSKE